MGGGTTLPGMSRQAQSRSQTLTGWTVVLTRPVGQNAASARRLRALGAAALTLPVFRVAPADTPAARADLQRALAAECVVFTSPAAVRCAQRLCPDWAGSRAVGIGVGAGTAAALRHAAWRGEVQCPTRADSEGVLGLAVLRQPRRVGLVTAPDGREAIAPALVARGARVLRAEVYRREPAQPTRAALARLDAADGPLATLLSSAAAFDRLRAILGPVAQQRLLDGALVTSSERLADHVRAAGARQVLVASGPATTQLIEALCRFVAEAASCSIQPAAPRSAPAGPIRSSSRTP